MADEHEAPDMWQELIASQRSSFDKPRPEKIEATEDKLPTDCGVCTYHHQSTKECRRHAPHPNQDEEFVVAFWNYTKDHNRCGAGSTTKPIVDCNDCTHWWPKPYGKPLWPDYKQGLPDEWWQHAGLCTANSPGTAISEGLWTFWRVTSMFPRKGSTGGCGDGVSITALAETAKKKAEVEATAAEKKANWTPNATN